MSAFEQVRRRTWLYHRRNLKGVRGFGDRTPLRLPTGATAFAQPRTSGGEVLPFSARQAAVDAGRPESDIQYLGSLPHGFSDANRARANGWWNDWVAAKGQSTMAFYDRRDIPLQYELADRFTICDAYFCSVYGSTNPNPNYLWTGTTGYEPGSANRAVTNAAYSYTHAGYDWTTYPERPEAAGVSWQIYQEWDNFTDNAVEYFRPWKEIGRKILSKVSGQYSTTKQFYDGLWGKTADQRKAALAQFQQGVDSLTEADRRLFMRGAYRSEPNTLVQRIRSDIKNGTLPKVSWLVPTAALSEHPSSSTPVGSANLIYDLLDAIASDPKTWSKTALFINFDENDGYFDHVPAPVEPRPDSGNSDDWFNGLPVGPGPRVPMTVVSRWTVGGFVCSEAFDHTSLIRFLEKRTGVQKPNISAWRRSVFGDLTSAFDTTRAHAQPRLEQPEPVPSAVGRWNPVPPKNQSLPQQEAGTRPTRPSPYRLSLRADVTGSGVRLRLGNAGTTAATFTAYPGDGTIPRTWTVPAGGTADNTVGYGADGYDLQVTGPGWSVWELRGTGVGAEAHLVEQAVPGQVKVRCANPSAATRTLLVGESVYPRNPGDHVQAVTLAPGETQTVPIHLPDHGWYDVVVVDQADPTFLRRMAGRLAGGRPGVTDPATGTAPALAAAIVLPQPLPALDTPFAQGNPTDVVVTVRNQADAKLDQLSVALLAPSGWTVERTAAAPTVIAAGDSADVRFTVTPPPNATTGSLVVAAHGDGDGLLRFAEARVRSRVAPAMSVSLTGPASSPGTDGTVISPGRPVTVTAAVTNAGGTPLTSLSATLALPTGWTATPRGDTPTSVPARSSASLEWDVVAPTTAARASGSLKATVTANLSGSAQQATASLSTKTGPVMTGYLLAEDFESVVPALAPAADLSRPGLLGWTRTAPEGWTVSNAPAMPQGTRELQGWTFPTKQFWFPGGQNRPNFSRSLGVVAVADPDDWDDTGGPSGRGRFDSTLTTPAVAIPSGTATLHLGFDSHYRQESPQEAEVTVQFDTGDKVQLLHYSSATSGNTNQGRDQENRLVRLSCPVPAGATSAKVSFRIFNAGNNWYWAIDNVRVGTSPIVDA
ncbi:alkaline phosphatase family protein [Micromonospora olivasterospora]|uniref:Phosphocholine-specific phospholipase C n=1 Tax=Micromonospora olivasterospora TaxID=1880 RepID=A0A562IIU6_MICOL|nr:alkaline phosphatase family protein [Micromonospora olivasterospora]TWH70736.1 phosphocholine-specific phospholipase C [Micromonospora olivasterospora]